jgi:hypothetical protein
MRQVEGTFNSNDRRACRACLEAIQQLHDEETPMDDAFKAALEAVRVAANNAEAAIKPFLDDGLALSEQRREFLVSIGRELAEVGQRLRDSLPADG